MTTTRFYCSWIKPLMGAIAHTCYRTRMNIINTTDKVSAAEHDSKSTPPPTLLLQNIATARTCSYRILPPMDVTATQHCNTQHHRCQTSNFCHLNFFINFVLFNLLRIAQYLPNRHPDTCRMCACQNYFFWKSFLEKLSRLKICCGIRNCRLCTTVL